MQYVFGAGLLFAQPEGADTGATTPIQVGAMRGVSVDMGFSVKDLHGDGRPWPLAIGRGTGKITCNAEFAQLTAEGFNLLLFGGSQPTAGSTCVAVEEPHVVSANAALPTYAASFGGDLGVVAALPAGNMFYRVASSPGPREYTCNDVTGAYGFGSSDGEAVLVSYVYANASNGKRISIANRNIGHTPRFSVVLTETFNNKTLTLTLTSCSTSRLGFTSKMEDFTIPNFGFSAAADESGLVGSLSIEEGASDMFLESFSGCDLSSYVAVSGNQSVFQIEANTPTGCALYIAAQNTPVTPAAMQREVPSLTASRFSGSFKIMSNNPNDSGYVTLLGGGAQVVQFIPMRDVRADATRRPMLTMGAEAKSIGAGALGLNTWYEFLVVIVAGAGNTTCTITETSSGNVVASTAMSLSHAPSVVDRLRFTADEDTLTGPAYFDDVGINVP